VEDQLIDTHLTGNEEDSFRNPMRLYEQMLSLLNNLGVKGADLPPTNAQIEVNSLFQQRIANAQRSVDDIAHGGVANLNRLLQASDLGGIAP
jgi:hypothetical protein